MYDGILQIFIFILSNLYREPIHSVLLNVGIDSNVNNS